MICQSAGDDLREFLEGLDDQALILNPSGGRVSRARALRQITGHSALYEVILKNDARFYVFEQQEKMVQLATGNKDTVAEYDVWDTIKKIKTMQEEQQGKTAWLYDLLMKAKSPWHNIEPNLASDLIYNGLLKSVNQEVTMPKEVRPTVLAALRQRDKKTVTFPTENIITFDPIPISPLSSPTAPQATRINQDLKADPSSTAIPGGIDFTSGNLDLEIRRDRNGVPLPLPQQPIADLRIEGFFPVITHITPVHLPQLLH